MKATVAKARKMFGKDVLATPSPKDAKFVVVSLDQSNLHDQHVEMCDPATFFDTKCPHCEPFLDDGAFMVYTEDGSLIGMRVLSDGLFETVMLR